VSLPLPLLLLMLATVAVVLATASRIARVAGTPSSRAQASTSTRRPAEAAP
jgi:hypothetical protein